MFYAAEDAQQRALNAERIKRGRVVGEVTTWGLGRARTVALAQVQQRRIAKMLG